MTTARDVMHTGCECLNIGENLVTAARRMRELDCGALPVCGDDDRLKGIVTDRDIVVKAIAEGKNLGNTKAGDLVSGSPPWCVDANSTIDEVLKQMAEHKVRRLPVLENRRLVGIISQADIAAKVPRDQVGAMVEAVSSTSH